MKRNEEAAARSHFQGANDDGDVGADDIRMVISGTDGRTMSIGSYRMTSSIIVRRWRSSNQWRQKRQGGNKENNYYRGINRQRPGGIDLEETSVTIKA